MDVRGMHSASQFAILAIAAALYAWKLPRRDGFTARLCAAAIIAVGGGLLAVNLGYSLYPTLTDNMSFVTAILMFALVVAVLTLGVLALWDASPWTALFCSSSAYLVQSIAFGLDRVLHVTGVVRISYESNSVIGDAVALWASTAVVLVLFYLAFARRLERSGLLAIRNPVMFFSVGVAMAVTLILDLAIKDIMVYEMPFRYSVVLSVAYLVICVFILVAEFEVIYNQRLKADVATMERTMAEQERQFDLSRRTIDAINQRVHDIRHHVARLLANEGETAPSSEVLSQVVREIDIYDAAVRTGNAALDVVLTEKSLLCRRAGITFSCIADGSALAHMSSPDLYALLGTALDDAIQAVREVEDESRRSISLNIRKQMGMAAIGIKNYRAGELRIVDGLPVGGGVSLDTILSVVERYDGTVVYSMAGDVVSLDALIPMA